MEGFAHVNEDAVVTVSSIVEGRVDDGVVELVEMVGGLVLWEEDVDVAEAAWSADHEELVCKVMDVGAGTAERGMTDGDVWVGEVGICGGRNDEFHVLGEVKLATDIATAVDIESHDPVVGIDRWGFFIAQVEHGWIVEDATDLGRFGEGIVIEQGVVLLEEVLEGDALLRQRIVRRG